MGTSCSGVSGQATGDQMDHGENSISHAIDVRRASPARMSDYLLGGINSYASDQDACQQLLRIAPRATLVARSNRAFMRHAVQLLAHRHGVRQFLDFVPGLPTQDNAHQIAQRVHPTSKTAYIADDPHVLAHAATTLDENDGVLVVNSDPTDAHAVLGRPEVTGFLDLAEPVAALCLPILCTLPDTAAERFVAALAERLAPGSFVALCQLGSSDSSVRHDVTRLMRERIEGWGRVRDEEEIRELFAPLRVPPPGVVDLVRWLPQPDLAPRTPTGDLRSYGALARV